MPEHFKLAIIGAGPGGISAAVNAARHGLSHVLFEKGEVGNTIHEYQLRKHVMSEPVKLPLLGDLSFDAGTREKVLEVWTQALHAGKVNLRHPVEVVKIEPHGDGFKVSFGQGHCTCDKVVLGIGAMGSPRKMGVSGEDLPHVKYRLGDPDAFVDMDIIVVGAGDAAIENVLGLAEKNRVSLINRKSEFARAKNANAALIEEAIQSGKIRCFYNSTMARIEPEQAVVNTPDGEVALPCQHIIARLGSVPPRKFMESCGVEFPSADPTAVPVVDRQYQSNVPGLHLIGSLIGYPLIKQAINQGYEVVEYILGHAVQPADQVLIQETFKDLPGDVDANLAMVRETLPIFKDLSEPQFRELIAESTLHVIKQEGAEIFKRNDYSNSFFSILDGIVMVELENNICFELGAPDSFGEMGMLSGRRRNATTRVVEPVILLEAPRNQMLKLISSVESVRTALDEVFIFRTLQSFFMDVPSQDLKELSKKAELNKYKKGEVIIREGTEGHSFHVIRKGSVKVSRKYKGENLTQTYISAGNYLGEMALVSCFGEIAAACPTSTLRTATVTAAVECETIVLNKAAFLLFLKENSKEAEKVRKVAQERRVDNLLTQVGRDSGDLLDFMLGQGLSDADNVLLINSDLCVGCDNCEKACAATHGGYSRLDRKGGESFASIQVPTSCRHCQNPLCMIDCPPDALVRHTNGEVVIKDTCIGCGNCEEKCPYNVIQMVQKAPDNGKLSFLKSLFGSVEEVEPTKVAAKCDMCSGLKGGPACVRTCPTGAAMRVSPTKMLELVGAKQD